MGLRDKAKGFLKDHEAQIQSATDKAKQAVNKASESMNQRVAGRIPSTGTMTPYGQAAPDAQVDAQVENEEAVNQTGDQERMSGPSPAQAPGAVPDQPQAAPPPPPGPPMPG